LPQLDDLPERHGIDDLFHLNRIESAAIESHQFNKNAWRIQSVSSITNMNKTRKIMINVNILRP
jgi:hypothetical protein